MRRIGESIRRRGQGRAPACRPDFRGELIFLSLARAASHRPRVFAHALDEDLRGGAERAVLEGDDDVLHPGHRQRDRQDPDLRAHRGEPRDRGREDRDEAPGRQQTDARLGRVGDHGRAGAVEPDATEQLRRERGDDAARRRQRPPGWKRRFAGAILSRTSSRRT